jgi:hypothetical protein
VKKRKQVGEPMGRGVCLEERQCQRVEERHLLPEESGVPAVLAVDPERPLTRTDGGLAGLPERNDLVPQVPVKEGPGPCDDRPEREEDEEREAGTREDCRSRGGVTRRGRSPASPRRGSG